MGQETDRRLSARYTLRVYNLALINQINDVVRHSGKTTNEVLTLLVETALPILENKYAPKAMSQEEVNEKVLEAVDDIRKLVIDGFDTNSKVLQSVNKKNELNQKLVSAIYHLCKCAMQGKSIPEQIIENGDLDFLPPRFTEDCMG